MIGIVIVSHSDKIAEGIVDLCYEMASDSVKIIPAGGTNDGRIGTDPIKIKEAIEEAFGGNEVVILGDIGSSLMNTELAIELLDEKLKEKVKILDTPIVEGSIVVAVQASISNDIDKILKIAEEVRTTRKFLKY